MKNNKRKSVLSIILYLVIFIFLQLPMFVIGGSHYTIYEGYSHVEEMGASGLSQDVAAYWSGDVMAMKIQVICVILFQIVGAFYLLTVLCKKNWHLNILALVLTGVNMVFGQEGTGSVCDNSLGVLFALLFAGLCALEFLLTKMIDVWEESVKTAQASEEKTRKAKEEKKRRLHFPGTYTELFYHMIWKNFRYDWKDYRLFLLCGIMVSSLSFAGLGIYEMMAGAHRAERFMIGEGLGRILWNAMLPMGICAVFLMVFVLIFYLKKWMQSYSIFVTLGIRKQALYVVLGVEVVFAFLCSLVFGCLAGNGIVLIFRQCIHLVLGNALTISGLTWRTYGKMLGVTAAIYVISLMATRDIVADFNLVSAATKRIQKERMPVRGLKLLTALGMCVCASSLFQYQQLRNHENVYLLGALFLGIFLLFRFGGAWYLRQGRKRKRYLSKMMSRNQLYYKSRTTAWYLLAMTILHICVCFYFLFQMVSVTVAEEPETLFPYDYVCIADDGDDQFFEEVKENYQAEILSFPMVRVSNADKTEQLEGRGQIAQQGEQIGISETTYHELKWLVDSNYKERSLQLDAEGEKVYLVHQQDRSVKAQPVDWTFMKRKPFLHIGLPCEYYNVMTPGDEYPKREIVGEEIGSLVGCFRQGKLENLVVFSDEYFAKAQEMWKYTNIKTGDVIEDEAMRIEGVTIRQGPTKLVLICVGKDVLSKIDQKMETFEEKHPYAKEYDAEISSYYAKQTGIADLKTEYVMKLMVNIFVMFALLISGMFLMYIKALSELEEKKERAAFLKCMGMRRCQRAALIKGEIRLFYWLPGIVTAVVTIGFTIATFHARMYPAGVIRAYMQHAVWTWAGYIMLQGVFAWALGKFMIGKTEEKDE